MKAILHFLWYIPKLIFLKISKTQVEIYDHLMEMAEAFGLDKQRQSLTQDLKGNILEVGCGTGLMFRYYPRDLKVMAMEPDADFRAKAIIRAKTEKADITVFDGLIENSKIKENEYDVIISAAVLCSVACPHQAISELKRMLKPGGRLLALEHVTSENSFKAKLMHIFNPLWLKLNGQGCNMDRDTLKEIKQAGFEIISAKRFQIYAPGIPAFPFMRIEARK